MLENPTRAEYETMLRRDLSTFVARCFYDLNPQTALAMNWHLEVIAAKLAAVWNGEIRRLIINLPPRSLKSLMSSWYRRIFPTRLAPHRQAVQEFLTTRQGYRLATSNGGVLTGRGADIILIDDPLKPEEALSDAQRQAANDWFSHTLYSRLNDKREGAIVIIMQRLHEDDLVGHVLEQEPWEVVRFPAIAEADEVHKIETIWDRGPIFAGRARPCIPSASRLIPSIASAGRSANTILPVSISNPRHPWAAAWSSGNGSRATTRRICRNASTGSCRAGILPTR